MAKWSWETSETAKALRQLGLDPIAQEAETPAQEAEEEAARVGRRRRTPKLPPEQSDTEDR